MQFTFDRNNRTVEVASVDLMEHGRLVYAISFTTPTATLGNLTLTPGFIDKQTRDINLKVIREDTKMQDNIIKAMLKLAED